MNILFVIQASHWNVGGHQLVRRYASFAHAAHHKTSVMVVPYFDRENDSSYHWYTRAKIAKKTYDHCFVFESAPPEEWLESFGSIFWVPMVEFTKTSHVKNLHPDINILWHSLSGFEATVDLGITKHNIYIPYVVPILSYQTKPQNQRVIVHQRARCFDVDTFMYHLLAESRGAQIDLWNHVGQRNALDHWAGPRVKVHQGWLEKEKWEQMCDNASVYVAGRAMEGIGLCVQEAAARGCVIAGPSQTVSGEYIKGPGSLLVDLHEQPQEDWLTPRYDWAPSPGAQEDATIALAKKVAHYIDYSKDKSDRSFQAYKEISELGSACSHRMGNLMSSLEKRTFSITRPARRRILSIQTCTWGGQGLFELWMLKHLSKHSHHSIFSSRLWIQKNDAEEQTEYARLMDGEDIRMVAPNVDDLRSVDPDYIIIHWSGGAEQLCDKNYINNVMTFISETDRPVIVWVHNVQPGNIPLELKRRTDVWIFPSEHAMKAYSQDSTMGGVRKCIPHFLDPEIADVPNESLQKNMVLGILGRIQWSKADPSYYRAIKEFVEETPGREVMWIGSSADGYLEGDAYTRKTIDPHFVSSFGPGRAKLFDQVAIGLFLSPVEESFCLAALEMASRGVPIITNRPEIKGLLGEAAVLIQSAWELTTVLKMLTKKGTSYMKMAKAGLAIRENEYFSYDRWEKDFFELLTCHPSRRRGWSVVVPCHNVGPWIHQCLTSIIVNEPNEIIIVMDNCTDNTYEVVKEFMREYRGETKTDIRILFNEEPIHHQAHSWKMAFKAVRYPLVALVDGDDFIAPNSLYSMELEHVKKPVCLVWSDQSVFGENDELLDISFSESPKDGESILEAMQRGSNVVSHLITFKAWAIPFIDLPDDLTASADKHLALQLEELAPWTYCEGRYSGYRWKRPGSVTAERHADQEKMRERVIAEAVKRRSGSRFKS